MFGPYSRQWSKRCGAIPCSAAGIHGSGLVALHHALAGWALWPEWHAWLGGGFLYQPGKLQDQPMPDSGYRHDVHYTAQIIADHPGTNGLPASFPVTDELYLCPIAEAAKTHSVSATNTT